MSASDELRCLQRAVYEECIHSGWDPDVTLTLAEEVAHLHEEVTNVFTAYRKFHDFDVHWDADSKPQGVPIELADIMIGLLYNAELHGIDLFAMTKLKHLYNMSRDYQAEGRYLHQVTDD